MQLEIPVLSFDVSSLLSEIRADLFPELTGDIHWLFCEMQVLACVNVYDNGKAPLIRFHSLLNHPETPKLIMRSIFIHELLHLKVRPGEIDGKQVTYPPEFNQAQTEINRDQQRSTELNKAKSGFWPLHHLAEARTC